MAGRLLRWASIAVAFVILLGAGQAGAAERYKRTVESYPVPDLVLINQDGAKVSLKELMQSNKPVILDFIYGTCTTICPILSTSFTNLQKNLPDATHKVHLVSVSIDPEHDSPKVMKEYLKRYRAQPGWDFLTGSRANIDRVMNAFNAYIPDKMSHYPITFIQDKASGKWIRIYGLMGSSDLLAECRKIGVK
ncbi:SCO family protein [Geomonas sp.]|uniref:SCO family protein n=1 Tax=Geomonas sp. TaxID=2651584 RepID=UPI002B49B85A|nr:SCO family protein [Geomonas sp.]HJV36184.1 SCO family protein [Geomonas sp.]